MLSVVYLHDITVHSFHLQIMQLQMECTGTVILDYRYCYYQYAIFIYGRYGLYIQTAISRLGLRPSNHRTLTLAATPSSPGKCHHLASLPNPESSMWLLPHQIQTQANDLIRDSTIVTTTLISRAVY